MAEYGAEANAGLLGDACRARRQVALRDQFHHRLDDAPVARPPAFAAATDPRWCDLLRARFSQSCRPRPPAGPTSRRGQTIQIGSGQVRTPGTTAHLVGRLPSEQQTTTRTS